MAHTTVPSASSAFPAVLFSQGPLQSDYGLLQSDYGPAIAVKSCTILCNHLGGKGGGDIAFAGVFTLALFWAFSAPFRLAFVEASSCCLSGSASVSLAWPFTTLVSPVTPVAKPDHHLNKFEALSCPCSSSQLAVNSFFAVS